MEHSSFNSSSQWNAIPILSVDYIFFEISTCNSKAMEKYPKRERKQAFLYVENLLVFGTSINFHRWFPISYILDHINYMPPEHY